jgi:hypothetical protein
MKVTKKARKTETQAIIDRYPLLVPFSQVDLARLNELLGTDHPAVRRAKNPVYPQDPRHLQVCIDGNWSGFSWNNAISPPNDRALVKKAMRFSIGKDMLEYRMMLIDTGTGCAYCGSRDDPTLDHVDPPFDVIAEAFLTHRGGLVELTDGPMGIGVVIKSIDTEAEWIAWHSARAVYQLLCRSHNASKGVRAAPGKRFSQEGENT